MSSTGELGGNMDGTASANVGGGTPNYTYGWNTTPTQNTATAINLSAGEYFVTVTDDNGCTVVGSVTVDFVDAVNDLEFGKKLRVYPTLTEGEITIEFDDSIKELNWQLINSNGTISRQGLLNTKGQLDFGGLSSGVYFIRLFDEPSFYTLRILKN
jgi:hypothetical protein